MIDNNYAQIIKTVESKILAWQCRHLTLISKITVIKTLLVHSLNHLFLSFPNPTDKVLKELQDMFLNFFGKVFIEYKAMRCTNII